MYRLIFYCANEIGYSLDENVIEKFIIKQNQ